jgi:hypothetical protein
LFDVALRRYVFRVLSQAEGVWAAWYEALGGDTATGRYLALDDTAGPGALWVSDEGETPALVWPPCRYGTPSGNTAACQVGHLSARPHASVCAAACPFYGGGSRVSDYTVGALASKFADAMGRWRKAGYETVPEETHRARLDTCRACPLWDGKFLRGVGRCTACGCTGFKLFLASEECPAGKWGRVEAGRAAPDGGDLDRGRAVYASLDVLLARLGAAHPVVAAGVRYRDDLAAGACRGCHERRRLRELGRLAKEHGHDLTGML